MTIYKIVRCDWEILSREKYREHGEFFGYSFGIDHTELSFIFSLGENLRTLDLTSSHAEIKERRYLHDFQSKIWPFSNLKSFFFVGGIAGSFPVSLSKKRVGFAH